MKGEPRLVAAEAGEEERQFELSLRPRRLEEFVGQEKVKEALRIACEAARRRREPLDHVLLSGPPGLGKTTLARIIAAEMGVNVRVTSGPAIERPGDLAAILTSLSPGDVLFIDEIHRLHRAVEEILYPAMEDRALDLVIGKGPGARAVRLSLPPFTLVGATTRMGLLSSPLRDRFGLAFHLEYYSPAELERILERTADILGIKLLPEGAAVIARRARGTPRVAIRLLRRVRDYVEVKAEGIITEEAAVEALDFLAVDELGLDPVDRRYLRCLIERFGGGPAGVEALAASTGEEVSTLEEVVEPYLLQVGLIVRTPRGRLATPEAYRHLGIKPPSVLRQETLWSEEEE
ncbi:Holliday junction DNA helicase RuvB [Ammonifex degensii KC4]|uniref:Holliday junction branch migration complex subunit RuvB n=1 Tax=Ammonifex degensii (strain DSM 10501 / KC4) TaxID=429009 RepID=C9R8U5_AMMDK|nr:Holliday junction branch migration DNA helicase RuvB [Ammonifex degensii]ACX52724.1 Holliday junction DNA helicase RuvB [Ammonifex degensii KC4]